jgi:streptogramin lyase
MMVLGAGSRERRRALVALLPILVCTAAAIPARAATPTVTEFPTATTSTGTEGIAAGPDGKLWFTESGASKIARITTTGAITAGDEFATPTASSFPSSIAAGPDGKLWFTEDGVSKIGRITTTGAIAAGDEFATPTASSLPTGIAAGPDGKLWFTEDAVQKVARITTAGAIVSGDEFATPSAVSGPEGIAAGPDDKLWFAEAGANKIARITTAGTITTGDEFPTPTAFAQPSGIATGPDGRLWFTEDSAGKIGRITTTGVITAADEFPTPTAGSAPRRIVAGPDGNLWFTESQSGVDKIGRITPSGAIDEFPLAAGRRPFGITAGPDGNLWFGEVGTNGVGRINTALDPPQFVNAAAITIPGTGTGPGPSSPYPSTIDVSGLQGTITSVRVTIFGLTHAFTPDVDMLLVGPQGQKVLLASDPGTNNPPPFAGVPLNFSDDAAFSLPATPLVSGLYKPTNISDPFGSDSFAAPAPAGPYDNALAALNGADPNGSWQLYVMDDTASGTGLIHGGWGLHIDTSLPPAEQPQQPQPLFPPGFGQKTNVSLSLSAAKLAPNDKLAVKIKNANAFRVTGSLTVQTRDKVSAHSAAAKRRIKLGTKKFTVAASGKKTVKLKLPKALKTLLKRKGKLVLAAKASVTDPRGTKRTVKATLKPKLKK